MQTLGCGQMCPVSMDQKSLQSKHKARKQAEESMKSIATQLVILIATGVMENGSIFNFIHPSFEEWDLLDFPLLSCFVLSNYINQWQSFPWNSETLTIHTKNFTILTTNLRI